MTADPQNLSIPSAFGRYVIWCRETGWGLSQIAKEGADVVGEQLRLLESGEMSSPSGDIGPGGDVVGLFGEATDTNVVSEHDGAGRHARGLSGWPHEAWA